MDGELWWVGGWMGNSRFRAINIKFVVFVAMALNIWILFS